MLLEMALKLVISLLALGLCLCHEQYRSLLPNGHNVLNPCDGSSWPGVGHENPLGGGARNPFGLDFAQAAHTWSADLCNKDSDGDGVTNGAELGDSDCNWVEGGAVDPVKGHPGVCEPIGSAACAKSWVTSCGPNGVPVG